MFDPTPYVTALTGAKTAVDIVQALRSLKGTDPEAQAKLLELYGTLLDTQQALLKGQQQQSELLDENKGLKGKLKELENWQTERARYQLEEMPPGVFVYALKADCADGEPLHKLCPNCFNSPRKSFLHVTREGNGQQILKCFACDFTIRTGRPNPTPRSPGGGYNWQT